MTAYIVNKFFLTTQCGIFRIIAQPLVVGCHRNVSVSKSNVENKFLLTNI